MSTKPVAGSASLRGGKAAPVVPITPTTEDISKLIQQYGCGPVKFSGTGNALYERHLMFDNIMEPSATDARARFEAVAHSVRDILSQRWVRTESTYDHVNPKRVY